MGSDKARDAQAFDNELPQHTVTLPGYWIGKTPVTAAQFRAFAQVSGHRPVRWVTWHDARAYCRWLSRASGLAATLPSEAEWEKATRGTDGRLYPWGDEPPDGTRDLDRSNYLRYDRYGFRVAAAAPFSPTLDAEASDR